MNKLKIESFNIIGISIRTTNENGQAAQEIPVLWDKFIHEKISDAIPNKIDDTVYSVYTDYESDHTRPYTTIIGCKVAHLDHIPDGMTGISIGGGNYIKLTAKGDLSTDMIGNQWRKIWESDFERVFTADFEVFGEKAQNPLNAEIDFLIAVE